MPARSHPKVDAGSSLQVPSEIVFRDVFGRDRDPVYDVARTERRVLTAQQAAPATGPLPVRTEDQVGSVDLAGGEAEGGFVEIDLFDFAAQFDLDPILTCSRQQGSQEIGTMDDDVRGLANQIWMRYRR